MESKIAPKLVADCDGKYNSRTHAEKVNALVLISSVAVCGKVTKAFVPSSFRQPPKRAVVLSNQCDAPSLRTRVPEFVPRLSVTVVVNAFVRPLSNFQ